MTTRVELRQETINAHGGVMSPEVAKEWGQWLKKQSLTLDAIYFQEVTQLVAITVRSALGPGWELERIGDQPGQSETAIAVRKSAGRIEEANSVPMGGGRWIGKFTGRLHTPRHLLEVLVDLDVCEIVLGNVFAPPGVDVNVKEGPFGKADRVIAWRRYWWRFRQWATRHNRKNILWATAGDLQENMRSRGATSPADTARRVGGEVYTRGIDGFLVGPGMTVRDIDTVPPGPGMDHHAVKGTLVIHLS